MANTDYKSILAGGYQEHRLRNGKLHCTTGPALVCISRGIFYYRYGKPHRTDGPAIIVGPLEEYWVDGQRVNPF